MDTALQVPADFPKTELEFEERFSTEEACLEFLARLRWPEGFVCPDCGSQDGWQLKCRALFECAACHHQTSVTAGTVFHRTHKPLRLWFRAMFLITTQKLGLSAKIGVSPTGPPPAPARRPPQTELFDLSCDAPASDLA